MAFFVGDPSAPTRFGTDVADTTDATGLFLKMFGGEVFAAFTEQTHTMSRHYVREVSQGKSAQFPKTWKVDAHYHVAGQEMLGQDTDETERVISIDGLLVSHIGIYDLDEAMSHYDVRARYTEELGDALARVFDENVYRTIVKTARADSTLGGGSASTSPFPDGIELLSADVSGTITATAGAQWWEVMRGIRVDAGNRNIKAKETIWLAVPENTFDAMLYATQNDGATANFLFGNKDNVFSQGGVEGLETVRLRSVKAYPTNLLPQSDDSANAAVKAKYRADFSTTLGIAWINDGVGTTKLVGMGMEQTRDVRRQEDFVVAKVAVGHGSVRNEGTWEVRNT
jgi:hypothetical protein